jgi:phosphatidylglycerol:prolipoprotein diacylglycerol transferase
MHPVLVSLGPITIYSYGVMVAIGFVLAAFLVSRHARRLGVSPDKLVDMLVVVLISGIIGARILYILLNLGYYIAKPLEVFDLAKGGLVWYGGFIAGVIAAVTYIRINKLDFWFVMDLVVPYIALAQALGRIGCLLNGCCYGAPAPHGFAFGVVFPDSCIVRHPAEIYSTILLIIIYFVLRIWQELPHFKGEIFLGYCMLYPLKRFGVEFFRGDNPREYFGMTISQAISFAVFVAAIAIFVRKRMEWKKYLRSK